MGVQVAKPQPVVELSRADRSFKLVAAKSELVLDKLSAVGLAGGLVCLVGRGGSFVHRTTLHHIAF